MMFFENYSKKVVNSAKSYEYHLLNELENDLKSCLFASKVLIKPKGPILLYLLLHD
tara:strand:- start:154 stop:321 length:168 start_codon:yes stop_codon:yes gene_type:complete